jgi:hypothetical protein
MDDKRGITEEELGEIQERVAKLLPLDKLTERKFFEALTVAERKRLGALIAKDVRRD